MPQFRLNDHQKEILRRVAPYADIIDTCIVGGGGTDGIHIFPKGVPDHVLREDIWGGTIPADLNAFIDCGFIEPLIVEGGQLRNFRLYTSNLVEAVENGFQKPEATPSTHIIQIISQMIGGNVIGNQNNEAVLHNVADLIKYSRLIVENLTFEDPIQEPNLYQLLGTNDVVEAVEGLKRIFNIED